jgi:WD40 repeat protein
MADETHTQNGFQHSKLFIGHERSITQLKRINNSFTRFVSASEDASIKIWDIYANHYCEAYSHSKVKYSGKDNTEIVKPIMSLEGGDMEHNSGVRRIAMNHLYLTSYSSEDSTLIVRDWVNPRHPIIRLS